jgi:sigma-E factor negative regulatory protein RseC
MRETGLVHTVRDSEVLVRLKRHTACLGCKVCSVSSAGEMIIKAVALDGVKVGDNVIIEIDSISIIKAVAFVYLLPAFAFLLGIFGGLKIATIVGIYDHKELFSILIGFVLLGISMAFARWYGIKKRDAYQAKIIKIED